MGRNPEQTKQLIIDKALPIFNTKGYNAASISDITSATGITKGAIYGNFKNKDEVATAAFERGVEIVAGAIAKRVRAQDTAPQKIEYLRDEKEQEGFGEVSQNPHHGKGHSGKVAVGVSHKDTGGIPIVFQ